MLGFVFEWKRVGFFVARIAGLTHRPLGHPSWSISFLLRWTICFSPQRIALHISSSPVVPCLDLYLLPWCLFLLTGIVRIISCKVLISLDRFPSKGMVAGLSYVVSEPILSAARVSFPKLQ